MSYIEENGYFIFGDVKSSDYGVWISGGGTFNAPARRYKEYVVPGRNGTLTIDEGAYEEAEVTYPAFIARDFPANVEAFRNAIMAQNGYVRMTDSYHPDEYYLARYMAGLEVDTLPAGRGGSFELTFKRDPRRFLVSGEEPITLGVPIDIQTVSGSIVSIDADADTKITGVVADINSVQDLHGYDSPWPAGGGKNLIDYLSCVGVGARDGTDSVYSDNVSVSGNILTITQTYGSNGGILKGIQHPSIAEGTSFTVSVEVKCTGTNIVVGYGIYGGGGTNNINSVTVIQETWTKITRTFTAQGGDIGIFLQPVNDNTSLDVRDVQLELGTTPTPYSNICPITGHTGMNIHISPTTDAQDGETYSITFPTEAGTVYGGYVDVTNGKLVVDRAITTVGTSGWTFYSPYLYRTFSDKATPTIGDTNYPLLCSMLPYGGSNYASQFPDMSVCQASNQNIYLKDTACSDANAYYAKYKDAVIAYYLATPIEYDLTPQQITTLLGTNNIWADTGDVSVEYGTFLSSVENPTLFDSKPLIRVTGSGTVSIGDNIITIASGYTYVDIDSEIQDCYCGTQNANSLVTFSNRKFPELQPGINGISLGTGVTSVQITPRWFIL